jgi:hypothetical protein
VAHGINERTLRRAFRELRGEAIKVGEFPFGEWKWKLADGSCPTPSEDVQN